MSWLDSIFDKVVAIAGVAMPSRQKINFVSGVSATDNAVTNSTDIMIADSSTPTGTGFRHVTSGAEDVAAKLVVNADVSASAAIAVSKLAAGTNTYVLTTVAGVAAWAAAGGGGGTPAVVFDDSVPATKSNIRSDRAANQGTIDNTKTGITQLGSDTAAGPGVTANYAAVGGGDQHQISGQYGVVSGGLGNAVTGIYGACGGGQGNSAGARCFVAGQGCSASNRGVAMGDSCTATGVGAVALGQAASATADGAVAFTNAVVSNYYGLGTGDTAYNDRYAGLMVGSGYNASSIDNAGQSLVYQVFGTSANGVAVTMQDNGGFEFDLRNGKAYALFVRCVARENTTPKRAVFLRNILAGADSGAATIDLDEAIGTQDPTGSGWTFVVSASGSSLRFTFTGAVGKTVRAIARIDVVEIH